MSQHGDRSGGDDTRFIVLQSFYQEQLLNKKRKKFQSQIHPTQSLNNALNKRSKHISYSISIYNNIENYHLLLMHKLNIQKKRNKLSTCIKCVICSK